MRYAVERTPNWLEIAATSLFDIAEYHIVSGSADDDVLVIPHGYPTWLRLRSKDLTLIRELSGRTVGSLRESADFESMRPVLDKLYAAGLLFVNGATGIRVEPTGTERADGQRPNSLLLKMTGACDMACSYCYDYDPDRWSGRIDLDIAKHLISSCLDPSHTLDVLFHGGEPLLRFNDIVHLVHYAEGEATVRNGKVQFSIQTNGLGLTKTVVEFLTAHGFGVGVSLDGPKHVHDLERVDHKGRGTFSRIRTQFDTFPEFMREKVGYISVVTPRNSTYLREMWSFFKEMRVKTWKLIPFDPEGRGANLVEDREFMDQFVEFLRERIDDILCGDGGPPYLLNVVHLIEPLVSLERKNMCMKMPCGAGTDLLVLDAKGETRACDCSYHPIFLLKSTLRASTRGAHPRVEPAGTDHSVGADASGAVINDSDRPTLLESSLLSANVKTLRNRETWLQTEANCRTCPWLHYCAGTCPARALMRKGTIYAVDDLECTTRLRLFPMILADVSKDGSRLRAYFQTYASRNDLPPDRFVNI